MRLLPGMPEEVAGESITSYSLINHAQNNPDILPRVWQVFKDDEGSPLSAILASKGLFTKGVREGEFKGGFKPVSSNKVLYPIRNSLMRKSTISTGPDGKSYSCDQSPTQPGLNGSVIYLYLDNNWPRPKEIIELADNMTQLYAHDDQNEPTEVDGVWRYEYKMVTNSPSDYVDTDLLEAGQEVGVGMTLYEQDFSETASEKYTYHGYGTSYLSLQRVKMSYSGTAAAMGSSKSDKWFSFNNSKGEKQYTFITEAEMQMNRRAAQYHEYQLVFGKDTVDADGKVFLKDKRGRPIMGGAGLLYGQNGAINRPMTYKGMTMAYLESILDEVDIRDNTEGKKEIAFVTSHKGVRDFSKMMVANGFVTQNNNVMGDGDKKSVNMNYESYTFGNVTVYPIGYKWFTNPSRPSTYLSDGIKKGAYDGLWVPMGQTSFGEKSVELIQLRPPKSGTVSGIDKGGDAMASSVDGSSKHFLWQTGIVKRVDVIRTYMPIGN
jgi:hypothetical protein